MAVLLTAPEDEWTARLDEITSTAPRGVAAALDLARSLGGSAPLPGEGATVRLWELLASVAAEDLTVARVLEPHLDALAIRSQAGLPIEDGPVYGVFAAEGPGMVVEASRDVVGWRLDGTKPWCSLAGSLDRALVTARTGTGRRLFEISLRDPGVTVASGRWIARGLADVRSEEITLAAVAAVPVGGDDWYLARPGFAWGGIGVAAIWFGASAALGRRLFAAIRGGASRDSEVAHLLLGEVDVRLASCRAVLAAAALEVDGGGGHPVVLAQRVRSTVSATAERVLSLVGHGLGPAPLALEEEHARRVADLQLYIRQDHAERDLARLGAKILDQGVAPW